jgi:hypothetical protein
MPIQCTKKSDELVEPSMYAVMTLRSEATLHRKKLREKRRRIEREKRQKEEKQRIEELRLSVELEHEIQSSVERVSFGTLWP